MKDEAASLVSTGFERAPGRGMVASTVERMLRLAATGVATYAARETQEVMDRLDMEDHLAAERKEKEEKRKQQKAEQEKEKEERKAAKEQELERKRQAAEARRRNAAAERTFTRIGGSPS